MCSKMQYKAKNWNEKLKLQNHVLGIYDTKIQIKTNPGDIIELQGLKIIKELFSIQILKPKSPNKRKEKSSQLQTSMPEDTEVMSTMF